MRTCMRSLFFMIILSVLMAAPAMDSAQAADDGYILGAEPDCTTASGYPGYLCNDQCVRVTEPALKPPVDYGGDFFVDEFTDAKIRAHGTGPVAEGFGQAIFFGSRSRETISQMVLAGQITGIPMTTPKSAWENPASPYYWQNNFSLELMRRPSFFDGLHADSAGVVPYEPTSLLDARTYLVEFTIPRVIYPGPTQSGTQKLRAWYIKYNGGDYADPAETPLIVWTHGGSGEVTRRNDVLPGEGYYFLRRVAYEMADVGHVLYWERRGAGVSEGIISADNDANANDVFRMLEQLHAGIDPETGVAMKIITPDGQTLTGPAAAVAIALPNTAKQTKLLHVGCSIGSLIGYKIATLHALGQTMGPYNYGEYNFKGLINWMDMGSAAMFSPYVYPAWPEYPFFVAGEGYIRETYGGSFLPDSSALASAHKWPAFFTQGGTQDVTFAAPAGVVEFYNRAEGLKKIHLTIGDHGWNTWYAAEQELTNVIQEMADFARVAAAMPAGVRDFKQQTTLKKEVCRAYRRALGIKVPERPIYSSVVHDLESMTVEKIEALVQEQLDPMD
jgi:hypothetical protein